MTKLLIIAASFSLAASAASACDFHQVHAKVDDTKVASVSKADEQKKMSTPDTAETASTVIVTDEIETE